MSPNRFTAVRALGVLGAVGAVACGDASTTAPTDAVAAAHATLTLSAEDSAAFVGALADLRMRVEPTLGTTRAVETLNDALTQVGAALTTRNRSALEAAISGSEQALMELASAPEDASDRPTEPRVADQELDAVRLVLLQARAALEPPVVSGAEDDR
jgi:hypothetical protein